MKLLKVTFSYVEKNPSNKIKRDYYIIITKCLLYNHWWEKVIGTTKSRQIKSWSFVRVATSGLKVEISKSHPVK